MKCDKVRELLLTDYLDCEADNVIMTMVDTHLQGCSACREYARMVKATVREPFASNERLEVPPMLWEKVRARISAINRRQGIVDILRSWSEFITTGISRPVFAGAMMVVILMTGSLIFRVGPVRYADADRDTNQRVFEGLMLLAQSEEETDMFFASEFGIGFEEFFL
jgi:predicted anti-sigma-YlaC factor YlaD